VLIVLQYTCIYDNLRNWNWSSGLWTTDLKSNPLGVGVAMLEMVKNCYITTFSIFTLEALVMYVTYTQTCRNSEVWTILPYLNLIVQTIRLSTTNACDLLKNPVESLQQQLEVLHKKCMNVDANCPSFVSKMHEYYCKEHSMQVLLPYGILRVLPPFLCRIVKLGCFSN